MSDCLDLIAIPVVDWKALEEISDFQRLPRAAIQTLLETTMDTMTFQTNGLMMQLTGIRERQPANKAARASASTLIEIEAVEAKDEKIAMGIWPARMFCQVMPDTPPEEIVPILTVRIADAGACFYKDKSEVDGHAKMVRASPRIGCEPTWPITSPAIDPIVQEAAVIKDGR